MAVICDPLARSHASAATSMKWPMSHVEKPCDSVCIGRRSTLRTEPPPAAVGGAAVTPSWLHGRPSARQGSREVGPNDNQESEKASTVIGIEPIEDARNRIAPHILPSVVVPSPTLTALSGSSFGLVLEHHQRTRTGSARSGHGRTDVGQPTIADLTGTGFQDRLSPSSQRRASSNQKVDAPVYEQRTERRARPARATWGS